MRGVSKKTGGVDLNGAGGVRKSSMSTKDRRWGGIVQWNLYFVLLLKQIFVKICPKNAFDQKHFPSYSLKICLHTFLL